MCPNITLIKATPNGVIYWFKNCNMSQLIYKNLCFDFYPEEFDAFQKYILGLDGDSIEKQYRKSLHKRKIPIPMGNSCLTVLLNREELNELQVLFDGKKEYEILNKPIGKIDYQMILN